MHFTGKQHDVESGLDNFGARYDSSSFGRFMTPDWAAKPTAVPYAVFGDPQSLNLYTYAENSPVDRADLDGHQSGGCTNNQEMTESGCVTLPTNGKKDPHESPCVKDGAGNCSNNPTTTGAPPAQTDQNHANQQAQQQNQNQNQQQTQQQKDDQQYHQALQQKEQQIRDQQAGPPVGSPEYVKQLSGQVAAETTAGEKYILAPAAVLEGAGVAVVVAPEVAAAVTTTVRAGSEYVLTHPNEPANFAQGLARHPAGAPPTPGGVLGAVVNVVLKRLIP